MTKVTKEALQGIFGRILQAADAESDDLYRSLGGPSLGLPTDPGEFSVSVLAPYRGLIGAFIRAEVTGEPNTEVEFLYQNTEYVECQFQYWIEQVEGSACCADKTRSILKALVRFFVNGTHIEWDYTQEHVYHLPNKVFTTHDDIIAFYRGILALYYGNPAPYLGAVKGLVPNGRD